MSEEQETHGMRALLALRWTVIRRRYASPLEAVIVLVVTGLAYLVGKELADTVGTASERAGAALTLGLLIWLLGGARLGGRLLFGARELALLLPNGVGPREVVRLRLLELAGLNAALLLPVAALVVGLRIGQGEPVSPWLFAALPPLALALGGASLVLAWLAARMPLIASLSPLLLVVGVFLVSALFRGDGSDGLALVSGAVASLGHRYAPGTQLVTLVGGDPRPLLEFLVAAVALPLLADRAAHRGFGESLDQAARRPVGRPGALWQVLGAFLSPLGVVGALIRRDVILLARGAFLRGLLILAALPGALVVIHFVGQGGSTRDWHMQFVALLVTGVLASASGFLFGVDFPRARRDQLVLERVLPVRALQVLLSRWALAVAYGLLLAVGAALVVAMAPKSVLSKQALLFLPKGALLVLVVAHHAVTYGMRSEAQLDPAEAAAYPMNGAVVVILFAALLLIHPLFAVAYPVIWFGFTRQALRRWETAEVETMHGSAA